MKALLIPVLAAAILVTGAAPVSADGAVGQELAAVRAATAQYHDIDVALADGYFQASECVPGMGYHYVNPAYATPETLDPLRPSVLLYAPNASGRLTLVAVEYVAFSDTLSTAPTMFGQTFHGPMTHGLPRHYELHVWLWLGNSTGVFSQTNPSVTCP